MGLEPTLNGFADRNLIQFGNTTPLKLLGGTSRSFLLLGIPDYPAHAPNLNVYQDRLFHGLSQT